MKLTRSNIVLVGGFNPHIIEPGWLMREGVVQETREEFQVAFDFSPISGPARTIRFELDRIDWEVGLERLKLASRDASSPGPWVVRLLKLLPHTPVRAVGNNFVFECPRSQWTPPVPTLLPRDMKAELLGSPVSSTMISRTKLSDKTQVNLNLTLTSEDAKIDANVHRGVKGPETVLKAISEFEQDRDRICRVVKQISNQEVAL